MRVCGIGLLSFWLHGTLLKHVEGMGRIYVVEISFWAGAAGVSECRQLVA